MDKEQIYSMISRGNTSQLEMLLATGALNANDTTPSGEPMIIMSACMGDARLDITRTLVDYGADFNVKVSDKTLLDWIKQPTYKANLGTIAYLRSLGAIEETEDEELEELDYDQEYVVYRETKPSLWDMRKITIENAQHLLEIRMKFIYEDPSNNKYSKLIKEFISGYDDLCGSAVLGIVYKLSPGISHYEFTDWAYKNIFDKELYLYSTWDSNYRGETTLDGFFTNFKLNSRVPIKQEIQEEKDNSKVFQNNLSNADSLKAGIESAELTANKNDSLKTSPQNFNTDESPQTKVVEEISSVSKKGFNFIVNSFKTTKTYQYKYNSTVKIFTASAFKKLFVAKVTIDNPTPHHITFSSNQFNIEDNSNQLVYPKFCGTGNSVIESGITHLIKNTINSENNKKICQFEGVLSEYLSFVEWHIWPNQKYEDSFIFEVDDNKEYLQLKLENFDHPVESHFLQITFEPLSTTSRYLFKKDDTDMELTSSSGYIFITSKVKLVNNSNRWVRISTSNFALVNESGEKIEADFCGAGNSVVKAGSITTFFTNQNAENGNLTQRIFGGFASQNSFMEWHLSPGEGFEETFVYLLSNSLAKNLKLEFRYLLPTGEYFKSSSATFVGQQTNAGCFIATAGFSANATEVNTLRSFRDNVLQKYFIGRLFIKCYYKISPSIAEWIKKSDKRKYSTRVLLKPIIRYVDKTKQIKSIHR
ncbi:MAG: hypothetical protein M5R37_09180 [Melioribacteraceae bacterium]|nr:hypothetical protein [Melioribacteraceae bacterium]